MSAHLVAADPYSARAFAVTTDDQRFEVVRLHEGILIDAILYLRSAHLVRVQKARVIVDFGKRSVERRDSRRLFGRARCDASRAD